MIGSIIYMLMTAGSRFKILKFCMNKLINYFKDSISEMKKVAWPTKKQTTTYTLIVIGMSIGTAIILGLLDYIFNLGLEQIIK